MKKANRVLKQLRPQNRKLNKHLDIRMRELVEALAPYEVDSKKITGHDFDNIIYDDLQTSHFIDFDLDRECGNSYNWNSDIVFNWNKVGIDGQPYIAFKAHIAGDVRGNYTDYMLLDIDMDTFWEIVMDTTNAYFKTKIKGRYVVELSTNATKEGNVFDIYIHDPYKAEPIEAYDRYVSDIDTSERNARKLAQQVRALFKKDGELYDLIECEVA